ncbi:hypothetical protein DICPUDRAFT_86726 [Dictyostelium purpureum]|uniref:Major facilitator superfamily (MFS) profile domain-containing protein n=1 Tax=Dictyostelium purpureum TaxID=5786 RepID=F0ZDH8_DICPU|nr:uncharacterized protein DICPUDRAFT_86726 [Dictyostelium purpureum]EGC37985.1 hypothetical protein DICPUDRAFT_86726 [Dictyostelium purpureum]|eukprot:XP_003285469.1 hypothetical protein DICPUDRAFT_86726 [Dictyostelium purpureum]
MGINEIGDFEPFLNNSINDDDFIEYGREEIEKKPIGFKNFKYKKEIIILLVIYSLLIVNSFLYTLFLPSLFINYVEYHFPNLPPGSDSQQSKAAYYKSYSDSIPNIFMFIFGPLAGVLSDRYGRKPVLFAGGFLLVIDMVSCYITILTHNIWPFYILHSIGGASNIAASAVLSFIADITSEEERSLFYIFTGVVSGAGIILGPLIFIGANYTKIDNLPLFLSMGLTSSTLIMIFFLKESLDIAKEDNRIKFTEYSSWNPFKVIKKVFSNGYVGLVCLLFISVNYTAQDILSTYYYYCTLMYNWGATMNGIFMGGLGVFIIFWGGVVIPQLLKRYSQRRLISLGLLISFLAHIGYALSLKQYIFIIAGVFGAYVPNNIYLIQSVISSSTSPEVQGSVISGVQAAGSLAGFLGALAANDIYSFFISKDSPVYYPGAIYLFNSIIVLLTFCGSLLIWKFYEDPLKKK